MNGHQNTGSQIQGMWGPCKLRDPSSPERKGPEDWMVSGPCTVVYKTAGETHTVGRCRRKEGVVCRQCVVLGAEEHCAGRESSRGANWQWRKAKAVPEPGGSDRCTPGWLASPRPLKPGASSSGVLQFIGLGSSPFPPAPPRGAPLTTVLGKGKREIVVVAWHTVTRRSADRKRALESQPVHGKLVGVDQPAVSRGSTGTASVSTALLACAPPRTVLPVPCVSLGPMGCWTLNLRT